MKIKGFTLLEVVITIGILGILFLVSSFGLSVLQRSFAAQSVDRELSNILITAARRARMGSQGSAWGVYIPYDATTRTSSTIVLFSGASYAARNVTYDQTYAINNGTKFVMVDFSGPAANTGNDNEIVFDYLTGSTQKYGSVDLSWYGQTKTIIIDVEGIPVQQ